MKTKSLLLLLSVYSATLVFAQAQDYAINTLLGNGPIRASGGFGALTNKFTTINGHHANIVEVYGGWYINHSFLIGLAAAAVTNDIPVLPAHSARPGTRLSYEYGQVGMMTEYVLASEKSIHLALQLFGGGGLTMQYDRNEFRNSYADDPIHQTYDEDWFFVAEPGVKLEMNVFKWMRFSPGISYRATFNSHGRGLSDDGLSAMSYNLTAKFGKF